METAGRTREDYLIQRLYARDETAMTLFYERYGRALYHTIWRIVRQHEVAEDLLQECMLKFWLAFPSYNASKGRLFTWALNIGRNLAIDQLRVQRRMALRTGPILPEEDTLRLAAPTTFWPEHIGVRDWLKLLSPDDQQLLDLLYLKGYTQLEASEVLGLPLGTIKTRSRRLVRALARRLNQPANG